LDHKVTKDSKAMQELKDLRVRQDDQVLQEVLVDLVLKGKGVTLDFLDRLEVMVNLEELVCQVLLGLLVNLGKMELKEILAHLAKKVLRDQKDPWVHQDLQDQEVQQVKKEQ